MAATHAVRNLATVSSCGAAHDSVTAKGANRRLAKSEIEGALA